jgi:ectoine hydroxylase-related dioxygenase (phytanoyl-CoA dioxygenase family)
VLPGSHRRSVPLHAALPEAHARGPALGHDHAALSDHREQVTLSAQAGDAIVLDYRLLHGTHANASGEPRDCVLLSFTPSWRELPTDIRAHLVQHLAQPNRDERPGLTRFPVELLPSFDGPRADLELNLTAPAHFAVSS